jgi:ABC-type amino acid transport substrate-binding protein
LRTATYSLLIVSIALSLVGCGGNGPEEHDAMAAVEKNKFVRIATDAVNLPFEFGAGTGVQGLDVDIGNEIGKDLGYEVRWVKSSFDRLFEILKNGETELVLSAISITEDRKKELAFSEPYYDSGNTIAKRRDKPEIKDLAGLAGKKVGVQSGATGHKFMTSQTTASNVTIVPFKTLDDALGALNRTEVDAVVGDEPILTYSIYKSFSQLIPLLGTRLTEEQYAVVARKNDKELLAKVNATIARLKKSGELEALRQKWFQTVFEDTTADLKKMSDDEKMKEAPKDIQFNFVKTGGAFRMDRLDGFQIVLAGTQSYQSSPIMTDGNRGSCRISSVPPGEYRLNMSIFKLNTTVKVPKSPARQITFDMRIGITIDLNQR